jgi:hypothetical protein
LELADIEALWDAASVTLGSLRNLCNLRKREVKEPAERQVVRLKPEIEIEVDPGATVSDVTALRPHHIAQGTPNIAPSAYANNPWMCAN